MDEAVSKGGRSAFVAVIGRPSVGKSTLLNTLTGHQVAIISRVPQTTRNRIRGIVTRPAGQLVFVDTPGFHESTRTLNRHMRGLIGETIRECELLLYVTDATRAPGDEEIALANLVAAHDERPRIVAINKIDSSKRDALSALRVLLRMRLPDLPVFEISALSGHGTEALVDALLAAAPAGPPDYPEDFYTDQPPEFRVSEVIRARAMEGLRAELPHSIYVDVADMEFREEELWVRAFIFVERESQRGMVVGKGGAGIKRIRTSAQRDLAQLFPYRIQLDLRVKVDPNWRKNERVLGRLVQ